MYKRQLFDRGKAYFRWMPVIVNVLLVALGGLVFYSRSAAGFNLQLWSGLLMAILGTAIVVYAYFAVSYTHLTLPTSDLV